MAPADATRACSSPPASPTPAFASTGALKDSRDLGDPSSVLPRTDAAYCAARAEPHATHTVRVRVQRERNDDRGAAGRPAGTPASRPPVARRITALAHEA